MKRTKWLMVALSVVVVTASSISKAGDDVTVGATADFFDRYVWRGQDLVDDMWYAGVGFVKEF